MILQLSSLFSFIKQCIVPECSGGYKFVVQPPSTLSCNPLGRFITLTCVSGSISDPVIWYWSQSASDAGVNGTAILPGDNSDE